MEQDQDTYSGSGSSGTPVEPPRSAVDETHIQKTEWQNISDVDPEGTKRGRVAGVLCYPNGTFRFNRAALDNSGMRAWKKACVQVNLDNRLVLFRNARSSDPPGSVSNVTHINEKDGSIYQSQISCVAAARAVSIEGPMRVAPIVTRRSEVVLDMRSATDHEPEPREYQRREPLEADVPDEIQDSKAASKAISRDSESIPRQVERQDTVPSPGTVENP